MKRSAPKRHIAHAGFSIPAFAKEAGMPESTVRAAVRRRQIEAIEFAGMTRIPRHELERIRRLGLALPTAE